MHSDSGCRLSSSAPSGIFICILYLHHIYTIYTLYIHYRHWIPHIEREEEEENLEAATTAKSLTFSSSDSPKSWFEIGESNRSVLYWGCLLGVINFAGSGFQVYIFQTSFKHLRPTLLPSFYFQYRLCILSPSS